MTRRWRRSRPHSANSGDVKSSDSTRSSPVTSNQSVSGGEVLKIWRNALETSSSPVAAGKKSGSRGSRGANSFWRNSEKSAGSGERPRGAGGARHLDSKFSLTNNEDFPALPGAPRGSGGGGGGGGASGGGGTPHSTPNKFHQRKDKENRHLREIPLDDSGSRHFEKTSSSEKENQKEKEKEKDREKEKEPRKFRAEKQHKFENSPGKLRHTPKSTRPSFGTASPAKKKSIAANSGPHAAPSFMKLSKLGQKIPERRGVARHSPTSPEISEISENSGTSPISDKGSRNEEADRTLTPSMVKEFGDVMSLNGSGDAVVIEEILVTPPAPVKATAPAPVAPEQAKPKYIQFGEDGQMENIPESMLSDQYGLAALVPVLKVAARHHGGYESPDLSAEQKELNSNIVGVFLGMDLSQLDVPLRSNETNNKYVYQTFSGPYGTLPMAPPAMSLNMCHLPNVYNTSQTLGAAFDMIQDIPDKLGVHDLFYLYYNYPKEIWQINAARELMYRGWRFNIVEKLWINRKLGEPDECGITISTPKNMFTQPDPGMENEITGIFEIYDAEKARITSREMRLKRSEFEVPAWEQKTPDRFTQHLNENVPKAVLWGPRADRPKPSQLLQGLAGVMAPPNRPGMPNFRSQATVRPPPTAQQLQQQAQQQLARRQLLSFADSPEPQPPSNDNQNSQMEEIYRQQMLAVLIQRLQAQQQQQQMLHQHQHAAAFAAHAAAHASSSTGATAGSSSSTSNHQNLH